MHKCNGFLFLKSLADTPIAFKVVENRVRLTGRSIHLEMKLNLILAIQHAH